MRDSPGGPLRTPSLETLVSGVREGDRALVGLALTLVESRRPEHRRQAAELLERLVPPPGPVHRVGISGIPGSGKSTLIEVLGSLLTSRGRRVGVLSVDPSSAISGGSILGDKTRMTRLANDPAAFVRPSPAAGSLGGVARRTREAMVVLEAAGHDVMLVETVGVGQSEMAVAGMVDCFVLVLVAGTGDELQGIKRGNLELVDLVVVNKAEGEHRREAEKAGQEIAAALRLLRAHEEGWRPRVLTASALGGEGIEGLWKAIEEHRRVEEGAGRWEARRRSQRARWMWEAVEDGLLESLRADSAVGEIATRLEREVVAGRKVPTAAAEEILEAFGVPQEGGGRGGGGRGS